MSRISFVGISLRQHGWDVKPASTVRAVQLGVTACLHAMGEGRGWVAGSLMSPTMVGLLAIQVSSTEECSIAISSVKCHEEHNTA